MTIVYFLIVLFACAGVSIIVNNLILSFAKNLGIRNKNDVTIRWSNESKPSLGGVAMYSIFVVSGFTFSILLNEELELIHKEYLGFLLASSLAFVMGISDDAFNTRPWLKLLIQTSCGVILYFSGISIELFSLPLFNFLSTILWTVILMNSLNMLDNMDGIAGTTTLFVLLSCLLVGFMNNGFYLSIWSLLLTACIGTIIGFLFYNVYPSKLFMGDGGSQFIGVLLAFYTINSFFSIQQTTIGLYFKPLLALVSLTPAAVDTLTVIINRLRNGKSPMVGGKDHTTHHLVYAGKKDKEVWIYFLILNLFSTCMTIFIFINMEKHPISTSTLGILYFLSVFFFLYRNTIKFQQKV